MNEQTKTEGSFKIQSKPKLTDEQLAAKNREPLIDVPSNVTKVVIPKEEKDAVQEPSADGVDENKPAGNVQEMA
jgi:acyl-CoA synthetase (NDP forming)